VDANLHSAVQSIFIDVNYACDDALRWFDTCSTLQSGISAYFLLQRYKVTRLRPHGTFSWVRLF